MSPPSRTLTPHGLVALLLLALLAVGCAGGDPNVAATVNGVQISVDQLNKDVDETLRDPQIAAQLKGDPDAKKALQTQVLDGLVQVALMEQTAKEVGATATDQDVQARLTDLITQVGGRQAYEQILKERGLTEQSVLSEVRNTVLREKVVEKVGQGITASDISAKQVDDAYSQQFNGADPVARHILLKTQAEAQEVKDRIVKGEDFAMLAQQLSKDPGTGQLGGLLGQVSPGQTVPEFEKAVNEAKENEVVGPVKTQFGFHIIQRLPSPPPHTVVDDGLRQQLIRQQRQQAYQDYLAKQRAKAKVEVNPRFGVWDPDNGVRPSEPLGTLESEQPRAQDQPPAGK